MALADCDLSPRELADYLGDKGMKHTRGAPYHSQTQGKIERWHQTLKNRILLENYFILGDLEHQIDAFIDHYNHNRYHESLKTSRQLMSTLGVVKQSWNKEKGSYRKP